LLIVGCALPVRRVTAWDEFSCQAEKGSNLSQSFKPARLVIEQSFGPTVRSGFAGEEV
jgi:hypothetical protein